MPLVALLTDHIADALAEGIRQLWRSHRPPARPRRGIRGFPDGLKPELRTRSTIVNFRSHYRGADLINTARDWKDAET